MPMTGSASHASATSSPPSAADRSRAGEFSSRAEIALHGVYEISKILAVPTRLETTLSNVLALLSSFLEMHHGIIALLGDDGSPQVVVGLGWTEKNAKSHFDRLPERAIGQIVTTQMPVVVENVADNPLFDDWSAVEWGAGSRVSFIGVPIKERDRVIGTLTLDRTWEGKATFRLDEDVRFLVMIANLVGQTVRLHDLIGRDRDRLMSTQRRLEKELIETARPEREVRPQGIVGNSPAIRSVIDKIKIVARSHSTVLLRGESGTGKELFARATHDLSPRRTGPFVKLNCAALPESMLESELFGHEKGAFTGALSQRKGRFELAHRGTLFLDEIGEISASFQAKLLRVLQEGEFERVGGTNTLKVDVRLVAATNKNLEEAVARGEFRADLYYRINVVSIFLPAVRDRREDITLLACEFLKRFNEEHGTRKSLTASAYAVLESCYFPGNVRELENCVRRTATLSRDSGIIADDFACRHDECLSSTLWKGAIGPGSAFKIMSRPTAPTPLPLRQPVPVEPAAALGDGDGPPATCPQAGTCAAAQGDGLSERDRLIQAMETAGWVQAKAARLLNLTPRQVGYALIKHNIPVKKF
ncbi:nif-specific transcriptional activator NifA [Nitrospirillum viridazoti]|uniref:Nif-specific regulatory protein n=1 Tax=Nitrospirillum viridazoti CBAmc TaxID=1441467 RepID=A0A248JNN8_9PROT|nr:nif-specific transcriptional activator NifA [Nitrospirillum amazonense]ASG20327.1 nif-specific transcriptional activator NifA [Nitrospirillum amazonense CBAmc]TWB34701.1 Nif-specific regulatory protein [Nitrospirillum amazonense]